MNTNTHIKPLVISLLLCCLAPAILWAQNPVLKHSYTFDDGTANDQTGSADATLIGGKIENGRYIASKQGDYIELPAKTIGINTYTALSIEAYIVAGKGNGDRTMLSYFGNVTDSIGSDYIYQSAINNRFARTAISCNNSSSPWQSATWTRCNALDDGLPHHLVTTFNNKELKLYVDGLLVGSRTNEQFPENLLENIGNQVAYLAKNGSVDRPTWLGEIDAFNIYEGILEAETIEKSAQNYLPKEVIAARDQLSNLIAPEGVINQVRLDTIWSIYFNTDWTYQSGDDSTWAEKDFDDSSWPRVKSQFSLDSVGGKPWEGIAWFRREFKIDSTLYNKSVGFGIRQSAASEIYLNGKLIRSFGQIGTDSIKEQLYNPNNDPFVAVFDTSSTQVIAIRYSNQKAQHYYKRFGSYAKNIGFYLRIANTGKIIETSLNDAHVDAILFSSFSVFFLAFTLLNLFMFFFYSKGKEHFYFALYTGSASLIFGLFAYVNISHHISAASYTVQLIILILIPLLFASFVFFVYTVFYTKMPRQFWFIVIAGTVISIVSITPLRSKFDYGYVMVPFILLLAIEGLRVTTMAMVRKKRNAVVIGTGVTIFSISILAFLVLILVWQGNLDILGVILVFSGIFSLPVTMLIYLSRERARTRTDLENRLVEVQQLSEKALEQEKREAELRVENTRKEVELQKAAELKSAYHNLALAHENLKATQTQLIQSEKMASLGELTAGIAHEIQNPLNFVNNFSEVSSELIEELKIKNENLKIDDEEVSDLLNDITQNLEKINHHGKRAESIVKGMLLHSRGSSGQKEPTDINALCDEYLRLSYHGFRAKDKSFNADFKIEADENLRKVEVVPQDFGRVLLNLLNNAFYAVDQRAKEKPAGYQPIVSISTVQKNGSAVISVKDNGNGIPPSVREKIFQPFFTTKPTGNGTGLGLSLSYDIIKAHGGKLTVETEVGEGSVFTIII